MKASLMQGLNKVISRIDQMPANDRRALLALAIFLLASMGYILLEQSRHFRQEAVFTYQDLRADSAWMYANAKHVRMISAAAARANYKGESDSLITVASNTARDYSLTLKRFQPDGEDGLRLSLESANFNQMLLWLNKLEKEYGVSVKHISVEKVLKKEGMVDASIALIRL